MQEPSSTSPFRFGAPVQKGRGVAAADVERAADALLRAGERPTVEKIRAQLGGGSPNTITPLLDAWWKRLAARLDAGPTALHRLPEVVVHVAEALWLQALEAARERVGQERKRESTALDERERQVEVKSYVLTLREAEFEERLRESRRTIEALTRQVKELTIAVAKAGAAARRGQRTNTSKVAEAKRIKPARRNAGARAVTRKKKTSPPGGGGGGGRAPPPHGAEPGRVPPGSRLWEYPLPVSGTHVSAGIHRLGDEKRGAQM